MDSDKKDPKKYFLFAFDRYYPAGGLGDLKASFRYLKDAEVAVEDMAKRRDYVELAELTDSGLRVIMSRP